MHGYDGPPGTDALRWMLIVLKRCAWGIGERERRQRGCVSLERLSRDGERGLAPPRGEEERGDPHLSAERAERSAADLAALDRLKPDERTALLLLGLGYSYAEIAEAQGWTHTKVNRCLAEGRAALRAERALV
jgi:DNA-directed RNA polymerase specialized sigma24 family protein